jgi:hypothetical protein
MATITLSVSSPAEGFAWNVNFSADDATAIKSIVNFAITCPTNTSGNFTVPNTGLITNVVNGFSSNPSDSNADSYVTWRSSASTSGQYPASGRSLDIWSHQFYLDVISSSKTWSQMSATYTLNPRKWSLIYDYTSRTAFVWSKGGTLTVSVV